MGLFNKVKNVFNGKASINLTLNFIHHVYADKFQTISPTIPNLEQKSYEEKLIGLAELYAEGAMRNIFSVSNNYFLKNLDNISEGTIMVVHTVCAKYFLRTFYEQDSGFLKEKINREIFFEYLNITYDITEQDYIKFNNVLDNAENSNEIGVIFNLICDYTKTNRGFIEMNYLCQGLRSAMAVPMSYRHLML